MALLRDHAIEYIRQLEARVAELEALSVLKSEEIERLMRESAPSGDHQDQEENEKKPKPVEAPKQEKPVEVPATSNDPAKPIVDNDEAARKEALRQEKLAMIRENVAKAEKERDERERQEQLLRSKASETAPRNVEISSSSPISAKSRGKKERASSKEDQAVEGTSKHVNGSDGHRGANGSSKASKDTLPKATSASEPEQQPTTKSNDGESPATQKRKRGPLRTTKPDEAKLPDLSSVEEEKTSEPRSTAPAPSPPPGFASLSTPKQLERPDTPLKGTLIIVESGIKPGAKTGEAAVSATLSRRDMYAVVEDGGRVVQRFEGTECSNIKVTGLKPGSSTVLLVENSQGARVPDCSVLISIPAVSPPVAPRSLSVVDRQKSSAKVRWQPPVEDGGSPIVSYEAELSESDLPGSFTRVYEGSKPECALSRLEWGTTYYVRVRAVSAIGTSPFVSPSFAFTTLAAPPTAPSVVQLISENGTSMIVRWDRPVKTYGSEVSSYQLEMCKVSEPDAYRVVYNDSRNDNVAVKGLEENTAYKFRVRAENSQGYSPWSTLCELSTTVALPAQIAGAPKVRELSSSSGGADTETVSFRSPFTVSWKPCSSGGKAILYHLEVRKEGATQWETAFLGHSCSSTLQCDGKELYNDFAPGCKYDLAVSASNDRGLGPRSTPVRIYIRPIPPQAPETAPRVKSCSVEKGTMTIEFDSSPNSGGSPQIASAIEVRLRPGASLPKQDGKVQGKGSSSVRFFESMAEYQKALEEAKPKPKPLPPSKFKVADAVDAIYHADGRFYHAEVREVIPPSSAASDDGYRYRVKFTGYENAEVVSEKEIRPVFRKGEAVTAVLYDTTAGAHAAGSSFVVKENIRRLPGEIVSTIEEGYFVKFHGRGIATQKTNSFDVFGTPAAAETKSSSTIAEDAAGKATTTTSGPTVSSSPPPTIIASTIPSDLMEREWFEACETADNHCTLRGLRPGAVYEIRIAAVSSGGGRGSFGPVHSVKMDPGLPLKPAGPPEIVAVKPSGRVDMTLFSPLDDGGAPVLSAQVQFLEVHVMPVKEGTTDPLMVVYNPKGYQSTGTPATFESSSLWTSYSYQHIQAGTDLALRYRVKNKIGFSDWSEPALARLPPAPPSQVQDLRAMLAKSGPGIQVAFRAPGKSNGSMVESYTVQYRKLHSWKQKTAEPWQSLSFRANPKALVAATEIPCTIVPGALYEIKVQAVNAVGTGPSTGIDFKAPTLPPSARPSQVRVVTKSHREFEASWDYPDQDETTCGGEPVSYETEFVPAVGKTPPPPGELARDLVNAGETPSKHYTKNSKSLLRPEKMYWFRVRAVNTKGASGFSEWTSFTMPTAPKETKFASGLVIERVIVRETSTASDLAIQLVVDLLPGDGLAQVLKSAGGGEVLVRFEVQEKGSSVVAAVLEQKLPSKEEAEGWREVVVSTGQLKANCAYGCRAQLMFAGVCGELSKGAFFTTKPAPHTVQKDESAAAQDAADQQQSSSAENQSGPKLSEAEIRGIIRKQTSASTTAGESGIISSVTQIVHDHFGILAMAMTWVIFSRSVLLLPIPVIYALAVYKLIPPPKQDLVKLRKLGLLRDDLEVQRKRLQDMEQKAGTDKRRLKEVKSKQKQLQHSELELKLEEAEQSMCRSGVMTVERLSDKLGLIRVSVPTQFFLALISWELLEERFRIYGMALLVFVMAISVVMYVVPRRI